MGQTNSFKPLGKKPGWWKPAADYFTAEEAKKGRKYPQLRFPYEAIPEGRFKELADKACEGGLSPGLVVPALMCIASALPVHDTMEGARINLYVCLLAMVGAGKDTAMDRAVAMFGLGNPGASYMMYAPAGERSISNLIGDQPPKKGESTRQPGPRRTCFVTYEIDDTMNKSKGESSGVLQALQWLYDHTDRTFSDHKTHTVQNVNCRLSWLTALPVGDGEIDETAFPSVFGERTTHGIVSRLLFGFAEERFDRRKSRNWKPPVCQSETTIKIGGETLAQPLKSLAAELMDSRVEGFEPGVEDQYVEWEPKKNASGRDTYHVLKVAIICALLSGRKKIAQDDWNFAIEFMGWQEALWKVFAASKAKDTPQAQFNETVIRAMEHTTEKMLAKGKTLEECWIRWRKLSHDLKWFRHGVAVERTIDELVKMGALIYKVEEEEQRDGTVRSTTDKRWVRLP